MGLIASLLVILTETLFPGTAILQRLMTALRSIDFEATVMDCFLAFLLFAGALHLDVGHLRGRAIPVAVTATIGVLISTTVIGGVIFGVSGLLGYPVTLPWALVFGSLISPTDPGCRHRPR